MYVRWRSDGSYPASKNDRLPSKGKEEGEFPNQKWRFSQADRLPVTVNSSSPPEKLPYPKKESNYYFQPSIVQGASC